MPELPEVETMVRGLRPALVGRVVHSLEVLDSLLLQGCDAEEVRARTRGVRVSQVTRRGKWVLIHFENYDLVVIQPRMTGGFWLVPPDRPEHVRVIFSIDGSCERIWFCDSRRLGRIALYGSLEEADATIARSQGPDALAIDREELARRLSGTSRSIKPALMDQKVLAGIGNIYADETLFRARIHPERQANLLTEAEIGRIHGAIGDVLSEAIVAEGSSFDQGYRTVLGLEGGFLAQNAMYGRGGKPCPGCSKPILRAKIAGLSGRSTHFCPHCQPAISGGPPRTDRVR